MYVILEVPTAVIDQIIGYKIILYKKKKKS